MKKELKKTIHEAVGNLRNLTFILKCNLLEKPGENNPLRNEVNQLKDTLEKWMAMPSLRNVETSVTSSPGLNSSGTADITPPTGSKKKLFSKVLCGKNEALHNLGMKARQI